MARKSIEEMADSVRKVLTANGGEMTHNALVSALETAGASDAALNLYKLKAQGHIKMRVSADENSVTTLHVGLPA